MGFTAAGRPGPISRGTRGKAAQIREAIAGDRIVCQECGAQFRNLGRHLVLTHQVTVGPYRATWGNNRPTPWCLGRSWPSFAYTPRPGGS